MKNILYLGFCFLVLWLPSCNPYTSYIHDLDLLEKRVEQAQAKFSTLSLEQTKQNAHDIEHLMDSIKRLAKDTVALANIHRQLYAAANLKKSFSRFQRSYLGGREEFDYTKNQIRHLRDDIRNKLLEEKQVIQYFNMEKKAVDELETYVDKLIEWNSSSIKTDSLLIPQLQHMLDSLSAIALPKAN